MNQKINRRILLVDPPGWQGAVNGNPAFPNIGLAYLIPVLQKAHWEVSLFDLNNELFDPQNFFSRIDSFSPHIIGFSCKTATFAAAEKLAAEIRKRYGKKIKLCFGGPHITLNYQSLAEQKNSMADLLFVGEGEIDLPVALEALFQNKIFCNLKNGHIMDLGIPVYLPDRRISLDELDFPDYSLFGEDVKRHNQEHYPIVTSRGCPYGCIYCTVPLINGRQWRYRSVENIIEELQYAKQKYHIRQFQIIDDSWNVDMDRCKRMCRELISRNLQLRWYCPNGIRADRIDKELAELMYASGCQQASVGLESGSPQVFARINKGTTLDAIERGIHFLQQAQINVSAFFIIGLPGDSMKDVTLSIKLIRRLKIAANFNILMPYPHTAVYNEIKCHGRMLNKNIVSLHFSNDLKRLTPVFEWNNFSASEIKRAFVVAHLELGMYNRILKESGWKRYWELFLLYLCYQPSGLPRGIFRILVLKRSIA